MHIMCQLNNKTPKNVNTASYRGMKTKNYSNDSEKDTTFYTSVIKMTKP